MRLGIRLQLLLALGSLLVLAFVPLFFAVAELTRVTMTGVRASSARALGRAVAGHVAAAQATHSPDELSVLLEAQLGRDGVGAVGVYDASGALATRAGEPESAVALPTALEAGVEALTTVRTVRGDALLVVAPSAGFATAGSANAEPRRTERAGSVAVLVRIDASTVPTAPLVRLVALYTGVVALTLLVFAYFAMTRLVVQPIDQLARAAERVAGGARRLDAPRSGARELAELGESLARMTERLRADGEALQQKVAEIERYAASLKSAQEGLIRSERLASVGRLAAGLAHEIGNPIAAILGFEELLLAGHLEPAEQRDFIERMRRETERIHTILRDLLDFARPSARDPALTGAEAPGSIGDAVRDVLALVAPQKTFRGVELVTSLAPDVPLVPLSHHRLVQVLLNLLLNAADAAAAGHRPQGAVGAPAGALDAREERGTAPDGAPREGACVLVPAPRWGARVMVRASREADGGARIEVEDNGPGVAPEIRGALFEPFTTTKEIGLGTGLGLAVCRGLVEAAGGSIGLEDGVARGARFVLRLPAAGAG